MNKILEELYRNMGDEFTSCKIDWKVADRLHHAELEQKLLGRLGEGGSSLLEKYNQKSEELHLDELERVFCQGFRCGAQLMCAVFDDEC